MKKEPFILAVSGVKNSGKTTLITGLLPILTKQGLRVAVIKHDGHDFEADVPGTDSYRHMSAGAYGTAVFSGSKYMIVKKQPDVQAEELMQAFPEADIILLEGFKYSQFPKLEVIRKANLSDTQKSIYAGKSVCAGHHLRGIVSDLKKEEIQGITEEICYFDLQDTAAIAEYILCEMGWKVKS